MPAGKVKLRTNKPIGAHYLSGGAMGRLQIHLVDFDVDGVVDILVRVFVFASLIRLWPSLESVDL